MLHLGRRRPGAQSPRLAQPFVGLILILSGACSTSEPALPATEAGTSTPPAAAAGTGSASSISSRVRIAAGTFIAGSEPGRWDRQPELEPALEPVTLGELEIDAEPYPGASETPLMGASRDEAGRLCGARGGRLCTELEWERACKGPASLPFANGSDLDPSCSTSGCPSAFGVRRLGFLREWTASELEGKSEARAILRGASPNEPAALHRCAHRTVATPLGKGDVGFRCCYGPTNSARVATPVLGATYEKVALPLAELAALLRTDAVTRELAENVTYFSEPKAVDTVLGKGPGDSQGFLLTTAPLLWRPATGATFLVVAARSGADTSFVAVYHAWGNGQRTLESSFVMLGEPGPVALAYNGYIRPRLHFSTCWGCPGETGKILYRDPDHAVILQP